jgi:hypothetical protein
MLGYALAILRPAMLTKLALLAMIAIFQGPRMSRSASSSSPPAVNSGGALPFGGPLLQQLDPLAKSAPLVSQQNTLLN